MRSLRYYEEHGLLPAERSRAGHRRFRIDDIETVRRIRLLLEAGLPLAVVAQVMPCFGDDGRRLNSCVAAYLRDQIDIIRIRMHGLEVQRDAVERLQQLVSG